MTYYTSDKNPCQSPPYTVGNGLRAVPWRRNASPTQGKFDLASCAKKNGLDAIHDTVHEMTRDEARHGKALKGLLERYFK